MAVWHVCQWGYWGESTEETCEEADIEHEFDEDDDAHESCGFFLFKAVETEFEEITEALAMEEP